MNIVFMGTPDFAVESLKRIYDSGHHVLAVISQPDRKAGRGMNVIKTPVKEFAEEKEIPVYQPERIRKDKALIETIANMKPDVIVVVAYGQILPQEVLMIPKFGCVNVHGSLLPKYRGAAPIQWAVINGDKVTGITTMYMDVGMDTGDMIETFEMPITEEDTYGTLYEKMKILGGKAIVSTLEKIAEGSAPRKKQPEEYSMAPMIEKEMGKIDWNMPAEVIKNKIRGFNPMPGAYAILGNDKVKIWSARIVETNETDGIKPGTIVEKDSKKGWFVKTGDHLLQLLEVQFPNQKRMTAEEYLRGHHILDNSME